MPKWLLFLINVGSAFHCLRNFFPLCCNRSTTNLFIITFLSRTLIDFFSFFLSLWNYLWLAETNQQPISQTTWLKVTPHCDPYLCIHWVLQNTKQHPFLIHAGSVYIICMLWLFQVFALTAGLYGCQVWATSSPTYDSSKITSTHNFHLGFLKIILGVKKNTDSHCVLRETGQMPVFLYWFRCIIRFWNSLLSSNNPLLEKVVRADLLIANRSDTWTYQVLHTLQDFPTSRLFLNAIRSRKSINLKV